VAEREKRTGPVLSDYLEDLVSRGLVSRSIAQLINPYTDEKVQHALVDYFWAQQRAEAREIQTQRRTRTRFWSITGGGTVAALSIILLIDKRPSPRRIAPPPPKVVASPLPRTIAVHTPRPVVSPPKAAVKIRAAIPPPVRSTGHSTVPLNLAVQSNAKEIRFSWDSMGPDYTYTLYSGDGPAMLTLRKEKDQITGTSYRLIRKNTPPAGSWWAITATNQYGGEGLLSSSVHSE
jgi:hypothetical protein